ncbi:MAG: asparaginase [Chloroflexi bacterium]|nr:asparaginase [Chloroflexota bacterium]
MSNSAYQPVYSVSRGGHQESLHYGAIAVVAASGELLAACGDAHLSTFLRSSAKPFQALPLILAGGVQHYGFTARELALICASHSGTDEHVEVAASIQKKVGIDEGFLRCGVHPPMHKTTAERLERSGQASSPNRHNCSGKHSGMLAYAKLRGWPLENYIDPQHPMQQEVFALFAEIASLSVDKLAIGVDGCSAPNWAAPLYNTALAYARLMDPAGLPLAQQSACEQVREAMLAHPDMVGGPGRFDTVLMQVASGQILSKGGAEGYQGLGLRAGALGKGSPAMGVALKIADGDARGRAAHAASLEVLRKLGALSGEQLEQLAAFGPRCTVTNWRGLEVGYSEPIFDLENQ